MKVKNIVAILVGIMLIAFGVGFISLNYYGFGDRGTNNISGIFNSIINNTVKNIDDDNIDNDNIDDDNKDYIEKDIDEEQLEDFAGISTIDIDVLFSDVNIIPEKRDNIKIHYHGYIKASFIPKLETKSSNNTLYINLEKNPYNSHNSKTVDVTLDIYVPEGYEKDIRAYTSFGDINVSNLNASQLELYTGFGNIEIKDLSGDTEANTSYGDVIVQNYSGNLIAKTGFGNIDLEYSQFDNNINASTSFGDIELTLPKNSQFKIDAECSFGDIDIDFPVAVTRNEDNRLTGSVGISSNSIELESSLGDIRVISK